MREVRPTLSISGRTLKGLPHSPRTKGFDRRHDFISKSCSRKRRCRNDFLRRARLEPIMKAEDKLRGQFIRKKLPFDWAFRGVLWGILAYIAPMVNKNITLNESIVIAVIIVAVIGY